MSGVYVSSLRPNPTTFDPPGGRSCRGGYEARVPDTPRRGAWGGCEKTAKGWGVMVEAAGGGMHRCARRTLLWLAASGAVGATLGGCAPRASPTAQVTTLTIPFQLNVQTAWTPAVGKLVQDYVDRTFNASHPGVRAVYQQWGNITAVTAAIMAGNGPYVVSSCCYDFAAALPFLADLTPYLRRDNIPQSSWSQGQLDTYRIGSGLFAVPAYTCVQPYIYRQDILDQLGLSYPRPGWTSTEAASLWQSCSGTVGGKHRYGASLPTNPGDIAPGYFLLEGFGGAFMDASRTRCLLDQPGSIAGVAYAADLIRAGVCTYGDGGVNPGLATGSVVFSQGAGGALLWAVQNLGTTVKWDIVPFPRWPVRPASVVQVDFYGSNAQAPRPDLSWALLHWATVDPTWTRFVMRLTLQQPALLSLWDEWEVLVRAAAPVLRGKAIHWWKEGAIQGWGYGVRFFKYAPMQAIGVFDQTWPRIWSRQLPVATACRTIARQVTAFERAAATQGPTQTGSQLVAASRRSRARLAGMFAAGPIA